MTTPTPSHQCRAGQGCRGREYDPESGQWVPALTLRPRFLCPTCIRAVASAAAALWEDYLTLHRVFGDTTVRGPSTGVRAASPTPAVPVNVHADALAQDIADTAHRGALCIADRLGRDAPAEHATGVCLDLIEQNLPVLLDVGEHEAMAWHRDGESWGATVQDGPGLAWRLVGLHQRASAMLGVTRGRDRSPLPCPHCEHSQLGRWHGAELFDCLACGSAWTEADYRRMTTILSDDYREFA
ncbi:hypothetical protein [Rhodococcus zopfii]|uniref:hypothetical protein n=1 Tax=Rhodococcus zopfii TaxID=43772 RepID=UPI003528DFD1